MKKDQKLAVILLVFSTPFFIVPIREDYAAEAATFPQLTSSIVIIGCILIITRHLLPSPLSELISREVSLSGGGGKSESDSTRSGEEVETVFRDQFDETPIQNMNPSTLTAGMTAVFITVGYVVGFLITVPAFVVSYLYIFDVSGKRIVMVTVLSLVIVLGFIEFANIPFDEGELLFEGGIPWL